MIFRAINSETHISLVRLKTAKRSISLQIKRRLILFTAPIKISYLAVEVSKTKMILNSSLQMTPSIDKTSLVTVIEQQTTLLA